MGARYVTRGRESVAILEHLEGSFVLVGSFNLSAFEYFIMGDGKCGLFYWFATAKQLKILSEY